MDNFDELTRLAIEQLIKEGSEFVKKRDITYVPPKEPQKRLLKPNKTFLENTIKNVMSSNNYKQRIEQMRKRSKQRQVKMKKGDESSESHARKKRKEDDDK